MSVKGSVTVPSELISISQSVFSAISAVFDFCQVYETSPLAVAESSKEIALSFTARFFQVTTGSSAFITRETGAEYLYPDSVHIPITAKREFSESG